MDTLDEYQISLKKLTSAPLADAIVKLNGDCYCSQCRDKLRSIYNALEVFWLRVPVPAIA